MYKRVAYNLRPLYMKKVLILLGIVVSILFILCFIPFNADKFIPTIEKQVENQYGVTLKTDKLTVQFGPSLVVKSPQMTLFYDKSNKFSTLNSVKIKVSILPLLFHKVKINSLRVNDVDAVLLADSNHDFVISKYLKTCDSVNTKIPKIKIKKYHLLINDNNIQKYDIEGSNFSIADFVPNKHIKFAIKGVLSINYIKHCDFDVALDLKNFKLSKSNKIDILDFLAQVKLKNFKASLVSDLKLKKTDKGLKTSGFLSIDKMTFLLNGYQLPYSNANFVMLGNKTSVSSTIYADMKSRLVVNGFITHDDNPAFNISVKSNKIDLKNMFCVMRLFSDLSNLDKIKDVSGLLYANFSLKGTLKHIKSEGIFKIINANVYTDSINITKLNSDIDFSDNKILIKTAKALLNSAPVVISGDIISNRINVNLVIDKFPLKKLSLNNIDFTGGILSLVANISGSYKNVQSRVEAELLNFAGKSQFGIFSANKILFNSQKTNGSAVISQLALSRVNKPKIMIPVINASFNSFEINILPFKLLSNQTSLFLFGKISDYASKNMAFSLKGNGILNPNNVINISDLNGAYPIILEVTGNKDVQEFNCQMLQKNNGAKISFTNPVVLNINSKLSDSILKVADFSINSYNGVFQKNFSANLARTSKLCVATGSIVNLEHPVLKNVRFNILKPSRINIRHYIAKINGSIVLNGYYRNPEIIGNIKMPMISDKYGCLCLKNVSLALTKKDINFDCAYAKIFDSIFSCVGVADSKINNGFVIKSAKLKSKQLDIDNLSWFLLLAKRVPLRLTLNNGSMFAENVIVPTVSSSIHLTDLNSNFKIYNKIVSVSDISANMYNGKVVGNLKLNMPDGRYVGVIQGRAISAGPIMKSVSSLKETISGKMDFDMGIASSISSKLIKKANIKFLIRDGQMSTLGKVEHLLYAQNVIADSMLRTSLSVVSRAFASRDTGLFKYMTGVISLNKDIVTINDIRVLGPNMSMYVTGKYGITSNIANLNILGRLSNTFVSSLGSFGTFTIDKFKSALTGEDSEFITVPTSGVENIPPLPQRSTKEFHSVIMGPVEAPTSVKSFMWISESEKQYRTREVPMNNVGLPKFIENLPY